MVSKVRSSKFAFAAFLAYWMLFGGSLFWSGWTPLLFVASLVILFMWAADSLKKGRLPILLGPALLLALAALVSLLANLDIFWLSAGWLLVGVFGIEALLASASLQKDELADALYIATWIWLLGWGLLQTVHWVDNRNLAAVWPAMAVLLILVKRKPIWLALPFLIVLLVLGSRGAILGLGLGLLAWKRPRLSWKKAALLAIAGLAFLLALTFYRPQNAFNRFSYWNQAANAVEGARVWFGVGPDGLFARHIILEPGSNPPQYHAHAHNLLVQVLAESGVAGGIALLASAIWVVNARIRRSWQLPLLIALLGHSMVDLPLYFPGPVLVFMLLAGGLSGLDLLSPLIVKLKTGMALTGAQNNLPTRRPGQAVPPKGLVPNPIQERPSRLRDREITTRRR